MAQTRKVWFAAASFVIDEIAHVDGGQSAGH
jgi:hypothetical protein